MNVAGRNVHLQTLVQWLCLRARYLGIAVVPALDGSAGFDVVLKLGPTQWDRLAAESSASAARNATNFPSVTPAESTTAESTGSACNTNTKEN